MYDGGSTQWAVNMYDSSMYDSSMYDSSEVYRLDIEEPASRWQKVDLPWRARDWPHVVGCWGSKILRFGVGGGTV